MSFSVNNNVQANPYTSSESTQGFSVSRLFEHINDAVSRARQDLNPASASTPS